MAKFTRPTSNAHQKRLNRCRKNRNDRKSGVNNVRHGISLGNINLDDVGVIMTGMPQSSEIDGILYYCESQELTVFLSNEVRLRFNGVPIEEAVRFARSCDADRYYAERIINEYESTLLSKPE